MYRSEPSERTARPYSRALTTEQTRGVCLLACWNHPIRQLTSVRGDNLRRPGDGPNHGQFHTFFSHQPSLATNYTTRLLNGCVSAPGPLDLTLESAWQTTTSWWTRPTLNRCGGSSQPERRAAGAAAGRRRRPCSGCVFFFVFGQALAKPTLK